MKPYNLEDQTLQFAKETRVFIKKLPRYSSNLEDGKQLIRSSGSIGANYIEANESFSKKDFLFRVKISRKEAKESRYWLKLLDIPQDEALVSKQKELVQEATELMKILGAIVTKVS